jgi:hypothetical protein
MIKRDRAFLFIKHKLMRYIETLHILIRTSSFQFAFSKLIIDENPPFCPYFLILGKLPAVQSFRPRTLISAISQ